MKNQRILSLLFHINLFNIHTISLFYEHLSTSKYFALLLLYSFFIEYRIYYRYYLDYIYYTDTSKYLFLTNTLIRSQQMYFHNKTFSRANITHNIPLVVKPHFRSQKNFPHASHAHAYASRRSQKRT